MSGLTPYWIFPTTGNPIPSIGSGLRKVHAIVGHKWVRMKSATCAQFTRITRQRWDNMVPNVPDEGQPLCETLETLRGPPKKSKRKPKR